MRITLLFSHVQTPECHWVAAQICNVRQNNARHHMHEKSKMTHVSSEAAVKVLHRVS